MDKPYLIVFTADRMLMSEYQLGICERDYNYDLQNVNVDHKRGALKLMPFSILLGRLGLK